VGASSSAEAAVRVQDKKTRGSPSMPAYEERCDSKETRTRLLDRVKALNKENNTGKGSEPL